jgi:aryl-phospho-beta-D-glucosidase BglC (GH1 family)
VGPLHTSANRIYDGNNNPVVFLGLNRYGLQSDDTTNLTPDDVDHAKQWGANFVRVALGEQLWLSSSCAYDPAYATKVDNLVNWITSRGMVALLDLHYSTIAHCGPAGPQDMADSPNSIDFWKQVAALFKPNPLVAFDLYNEPNNISNAVWLNGGQVTQNGVTFQAAGMQQMYDAVRGQGATNLVFASGNNWGSTVPPLLTGDNIVYAAHAYTCGQAPPPNCSTPDPYDPPPTLGTWASPSQAVPVMVTEFGWPDKNDGRYNANVISYAQSHGWGWAVFAWSGTTTGRFDLVADVGPGAAYDPTASGMPVVKGLNTNR